MSIVLVTGLRGFIGRRCLHELVRRGYEIHGVTRRGSQGACGPVRWHRADLLDDDDVLELMRKVRAKRLLHLAWVGDHPAFWKSIENAKWARSSLRLVKSFMEMGGERVVVSGSCAEYKVPRMGPCLEGRTAVEPTTPYGIAKAALHAELCGYAERTGLSVGWARIFFVYGQGEPMSKLISSVIRDSASGRQLDIRDPHRLVDYISVEDAGRALAMLLDSSLEGAVNIGSGNPRTVARVANIVLGLLPTLQRVKPIKELQASAGGLYADTTRLRHELGFSSRVTLEQGISEMIVGTQNRSG